MLHIHRSLLANLPRLSSTYQNYPAILLYQFLASDLRFINMFSILLSWTYQNFYRCLRLRIDGVGNLYPLECGPPQLLHVVAF